MAAFTKNGRHGNRASWWRQAWFAIGTLSCAVLGSNGAMADADKKRGEKLFVVCATCHGDKAQGNVDTNAPRLAGQYEWYLRRQLQNFRAGARGAEAGDVYGQIMRPMALGLPDEQAIEDVIAYIMTLKPKRYRYRP